MIRIEKTELNAYATLLSVVFLWGASFAVSKIGLYELSPLNLAGLRFSLASVFFVILLVMQNPIVSLERQDIFTLIIAGFMAITSYFYIQYTGLLYTTSINAALLLATSPIWTTIFSVVIGLEQITIKAFGGILLAFLGISLVISKGQLFLLFSSQTIYGDMLLLLNALVWAGFTLYGKKIMEKYSPFTAMAYIHIFGTIMLLPFILIPNKLNPVTVIDQLSNISITTIISIFYLAILCSVYGFGMWYKGITQIGAVRTASFYFICPLFAVFAGNWLLNESFHLSIVIGGLMVIFGVYITNKFKIIIGRN